MNQDNSDTANPQKQKSSTRFFILMVLALVVALMINERFSSVKSVIDWSHDLQEALTASAKDGKPVLLNFSSQGCRYCVQMETEVIVQDDIKSAIGKYVPVKLDAFENLEAAARYEVNALPAYIIADADGNKLAMVDGFQPFERFKKFLEHGLAITSAKEQ